MDKLYGEQNISFEQMGFVVSVINKCTNNYNFLINLVNGDYFISEAAVTRFGFPSPVGTDYFQLMAKMVYPDDVEAINKDIAELKGGVKEIHDMRYRWLSVEGEIVWINCSGRVIKNSEGRPSLLLGRIAELGNKAEADDTTGLLKENRFEEYVNGLLDKGSRPEGSVIYVGVDDLRAINEIYGYKFGNHVIKNVAACILESCKPEDRLYRTNGDGFLVYFPYIVEEEDAINAYRIIRYALDSKIESEEFTTIYTISAGIVPDIGRRTSFEQIRQHAEFSLKEAKKAGRNTYFVFDDNEYEAFIQRSSLGERLHKAVRKNFKNFEVFYQPVVDAADYRVCGAEALIRWRDEDGNYIPPFKFVPILEESRHIVPVGRWVLENALKTCSEWVKVIPGFHMNVNLSYVQLEKSNVADIIGALLDEYAIPAESLTLELTESGYIETGSHFYKFQSKAKALGCKIAIDDFGTGYSNLRYMNEIEANVLKIDRSFTERIMENESDYQLIRNIISMAHGMHIKVCVEGIENEQELKKISELEPDYFQGYYFGRPVNKRDFEEKNLG